MNKEEIKISINKIDEDNILSYEEFMDKYKKELSNDMISLDVINNMVATMKYCYKWRKENYIDNIAKIYIAILEIKKIDYPNGSIESFYKLIRNINSISSDYDIKKYNIKELCEEAYNMLLNDGIDGKYMEYKIPEEFKYKHLFDINYHVNCILRCKISNELREEINKGTWRYLL